MNFIDKALEEITNGEDFVQAMADIYEYPEVRSELYKLPSWIRNIITVIDYDTELAMNGLDFKSYGNIIDALTNMGLTEEAEVLITFEKKPEIQLNEVEKAVYKSIKSGINSTDVLALKLGFKIYELITITVSLEMKGLIVKGPDGRFGAN